MENDFLQLFTNFLRALVNVYLNIHHLNENR